MTPTATAAHSREAGYIYVDCIVTNKATLARRVGPYIFDSISFSAALSSIDVADRFFNRAFSQQLCFKKSKRGQTGARSYRVHVGMINMWLGKLRGQTR